MAGRSPPEGSGVGDWTARTAPIPSEAECAAAVGITSRPRTTAGPRRSTPPTGPDGRAAIVSCVPNRSSGAGRAARAGLHQRLQTIDGGPVLERRDVGAHLARRDDFLQQPAHDLPAGC